MTINNSGSDLNDYQVQVVLTTTTFDYSHANADGSDMRFADLDETTELYYWMDEWDNTGESLFWVKIPTVPAGSKTIYMCYGSSSATSSSNEKNVMVSDYAEDVEPNNIFFTLTDTTESLEQSLSGNNSIKAVTGSNVQGSYSARANITVPDTPYITEAAVYLNNTQTTGDHFHIFVYDSGAFAWVGPHVCIFEGLLQYHDGAVFISTGYTVPTGQWVRFKAVIKSNSFDLYTNDGTGWISRVTDGVFIAAMSQGDSVIIDLANFDSILATPQPATYWDNYFNRKYASSEPTATIGLEETGGGYALSGIFISASHYSPNIISWNNIYWTEDITGAGTDLELQLATNKDSTTWEFKGPDGSTSTYYSNPGGESIWSGHGGDNYVKYRAYLSDDDGSNTPILKDITISYSVDVPPESPVLVSPVDSSSINNSTPTLTWNVPIDGNEDNLHFKVEISTDGSFSSQISGSPYESQVSTTGFNPAPPLTQGTGQCSYNIQNALEEKSYFWKVSAWDGKVYGNESSVWSFEIDLTAPGPVTSLSAQTGVQVGEIALSWSAPGDDGYSGKATKYIIKYATSGFDEAEWEEVWVKDVNSISLVPEPKTSGSSEGMTVTGLSCGVTYWFRIKTEDEMPNISGIDTTSPQASAKAKESAVPLAPEDAQLDNITPTSMRLTWTDKSSNEDGFKLERSTDGTNYIEIDVVGANISTYTGTGISSLLVNAQYWFRVRAFNIEGDRDYSEVLPRYTSANIPAVPTLTGNYDETNNYHIDITINENGNPSGTEYVVYYGTNSVQADGTISADAYWSSDLSRLHKDLIPNTTYEYTVKAKNKEDVVTNLSDIGSCYLQELIASKISLTSEPTNIVADGSSTSPLTATIQTEDDKKVFSSTATVTFSITVSTAPGRLPGGTTSYVVAAESGIATTTLTSTIQTGTVRVTASSFGLDQGSVDIITTAGEVVKVVLVPTDNKLVADTRHELLIYAEIKDINDNLVTTSTYTITFKRECAIVS